MKKHSNVIESKYSVQIYDGLELICKNDNFDSAEEAAASASRIVKSQKMINPTDTTYACVFGGKKMLFYFD